MDQFASPDIPAYWCYFLVLSLGLLGARASLNELLKLHRDRWAFLSTWLLFGMYVLVPLFLFWFLDYTAVIRDTSLFAALIVTLGYRQIFSAGVQGILMPGETAKLWVPIQKWADRLAERIGTKQSNQKERFDEKVWDYLAAGAQHEAGMRGLAWFYSKDSTALGNELKSIAELPPDLNMSQAAWDTLQTRRRVRVLLNDLRKAKPDDFGYYLRERDLIPWWGYQVWLGAAKSRAIAWLLTALLTGLLLWGALWFRNSGAAQLWYHQWRFTKSSASELDRIRSLDYLVHQLDRVSPGDPSPAASAASGFVAKFRQLWTPQIPPPKPDAVLQPVLRLLERNEVPQTFVQDVERLVMKSRSATFHDVLLPLLIRKLYTPNPDVRLRIHQILLYFRKTDFPGSLPKSKDPGALEKWTPSKDESPTKVDEYVRLWELWWKKASTKPSALGTPTPPKPAPASSQKKTS